MQHVAIDRAGDSRYITPGRRRSTTRHSRARGMRLVAHARAISADAPDFVTFAGSNPMLFDRRHAFACYGVAP